MLNNSFVIIMLSKYKNYILSNVKRHLTVIAGKKPSGNLPGPKIESIPNDLHVKMPNFTAKMNMVTAWHEKRFWFLWLISPFKTTVQEVHFYRTHAFK